MAGIIKLNGIVLKATEYGENDKILDLLTFERGRCVACAKGVRKPTAKNHAASHPLFFGEFSLYEKDDRLWLRESSMTEDFYSIDAGIEKLSLYTYLVDVVSFVTNENDPDIELTRLLLNTLYFCKTCPDTLLVKTVFELKASEILGFLPNLKCCAICGKDGGLVYYPSLDMAKCPDCAKEDKEHEGRFLDRVSLEACRFVLGSKPERIFAFNVDKETLERMSAFSSYYLTDKLEQHFRSEDYYYLIRKS